MATDFAVALHRFLTAHLAGLAAGFVLTGISLASWGLTGRHARLRILALACAGTVVLLGLLTLCEFVAGVDLGIDQRLFREASGAVGTLAPGAYRLEVKAAHSAGPDAPVSSVDFDVE